MSDTLIPSDVLPGLLEHEDGSPWCGPCEILTDRTRLDTRRPEVRDQVARVMARILGVPVGATAPGFEFVPPREASSDDSGSGALCVLGAWERVLYAEERDAVCCNGTHVSSLSSIPLDSPDREALALAAIARWLGDENRAGRVVSHE